MFRFFKFYVILLICRLGMYVGVLVVVFMLFEMLLSVVLMLFLWLWLLFLFLLPFGGGFI